MARQTINDDDRAQWVDNDEGLYREFQSSGLGMRAFVRANRERIDAHIVAVRDAPPRARTWRDYCR